MHIKNNQGRVTHEGQAFLHKLLLWPAASPPALSTSPTLMGTAQSQMWKELRVGGEGATISQHPERLLGRATLRRLRCLIRQRRQLITLQKPWVQLDVYLLKRFLEYLIPHTGILGWGN